MTVIWFKHCALRLKLDFLDYKNTGSKRGKSLTDLMLDRFCSDISNDLPCGENLEYDPAFQRLENDIKGTPERQLGDSNIPAEPPDWKKVRDLSFNLLERSHDIQICVYLVCALVHIDGLSGLSQGLALIQKLLHKYWDDVFPVQDSDDDYPLLRMNVLTGLNDYQSFIAPIGQIPLTHSQRLGFFSWHDFEVADGKIPALVDSGESPPINVIEAAFTDTEQETLRQKLTDVKNANEHINAILEITIDKVGEVNSPDLSKLIHCLKSVARILQQHIHANQPSASMQNESGEETLADSTGADNSVTQSFTGVIRNRDDVVRAIDAICQYFEQHEPSSPIPFLLHRSKKLLVMNFMEILNDMTPEAINQAEKICGKQEDNNHR